LQDTTYLEQMHYGDRPGGRQTNYNKVYERAESNASHKSVALHVGDEDDDEDEAASKEEDEEAGEEEEPEVVADNAAASQLSQPASTKANASGNYPVPVNVGQASELLLWFWCLE
jgi:hypothetical protein